MLVVWIVWVGQQLMLVWIDQQVVGQQQCVGIVGGDQDLFGIDLYLVVVLVEIGDGLVQGWQVVCGGVLGMFGCQGCLVGLYDWGGGSEVWFVDFQVDDVVVGLFQCLCVGQQ